jgi:hypothetical protein
MEDQGIITVALLFDDYFLRLLIDAMAYILLTSSIKMAHELK